MSQKYKDNKEKEDIKPTLELSLPSTSSAKSALQEALQATHQEEEEEDKKKGKPKKKRPPSKICICGHPSCGIGPMQEKQGEEVEG